MPQMPLTLTSDRFRSLRDGGIEVDTAPRRLSEYSYDASNYRVAPVAVIFPRSVADVVAVARFASEQGIPLVSRACFFGGITPLAKRDRAAARRFLERVVDLHDVPEEEHQ